MGKTEVYTFKSFFRSSTESFISDCSSYISIRTYLVILNTLQGLLHHDDSDKPSQQYHVLQFVESSIFLFNWLGQLGTMARPWGHLYFSNSSVSPLRVSHHLSLALHDNDLLLAA